MIIYILYTSIVILLIISTLFFTKFRKLKKYIKSYEEIGTGRVGFYMDCKSGYYSNYKSIVYIKELDRYNNGYSKIVIDRIEPIDKSSSINAIKYITRNFITLKETENIDWLESEDAIKKSRKEKLENINKI